MVSLDNVSTSDVTRIEDDHGGMWKESAIAYFKALLKYLPEGDRESIPKYSKTLILRTQI
jgi:hypothetical protein